MDDWYMAHYGADPETRELFMRNYWKSIQGDAQDGYTTDWEQPKFNHVVSMTCGAYANEFLSFPSWQQQFSEIVKSSGLLLGPEPWRKEV